MVDFNMYFEYVQTGHLINKVPRYGGKDGKSTVAAVGDYAGTTTSESYQSLGLDYKSYATHAVIWEMFNGPILEGYVIDHIDGDKTNNKLENLRLVTPSLNSRNRVRKEGLSGLSLRTFLKKGKHYSYWRVSWTTNDLKHMTKDFSCLKFGNDVAKQLALNFRLEVMQESGYTARHIYGS